MSQIPAELYYSQNHEWLQVEENCCYRVGITDQAQALLGDIIFVDLPGLNGTVIAGENCAVTESVKAASDVSAPMSGEIVAINEDLENNPELINRDPYGEGWLFIIQATDPSELNNLLSASEYQDTLEEMEQTPHLSIPGRVFSNCCSVEVTGWYFNFRSSASPDRDDSGAGSRVVNSR